MSIGSREAWEGTRELRERVAEAIATDNVQRLGDLVSTNREAVLRMPQVHDYLERMRGRGGAWKRVLGTPGARGRPREDNIGLVLRVDKCMDVLELRSVAEAARRLEGVLCLSPRTIQNRYTRYAPLVRTMLKGYAAEAGMMTEDSYEELFQRPS